MNTAHVQPTGASALLTDLYQLTMAYGYWKTGKADQEAVFHLLFRKQPFQGGFTLSCGLADSIEYLLGFKFEKTDLEYLGKLKGNDGRRLFESAFLKYLGSLKLRLDVDAIPEGTVVFPQEPLLRIRGPILQAQLVETALLNLVNFRSQTCTRDRRRADSEPGSLHWRVRRNFKCARRKGIRHSGQRDPRPQLDH